MLRKPTPPEQIRYYRNILFFLVYKTDPAVFAVHALRRNVELAGFDRFTLIQYIHERQQYPKQNKSAWRQQGFFPDSICQCSIADAPTRSARTREARPPPPG